MEKFLVKFDESKAGTNVTVIAEIEKSKDSLILNSKGNSLWSVLSIEKPELQMISQQLEDVPKPMTAILTLHQTEPHAYFTGTLDIFELQEEREFRTFLSISLFSASLGILLLLFLNKLKHLAHGADVPENQQENTPS